MLDEREYTNEEHLIFNYVFGIASDEERHAAEALINASEVHKAFFIEIQHKYSLTQEVLATPDVSIDSALEKFHQRADEHENREPAIERKKTIPLILKLSAVAASLLVIFAVSYYLISNDADMPRRKIIAQNETISDTLPDGSRLALNKHTSISVFNKLADERSVVLHSGEVLFRVAHDTLKPFRVKAGRCTVTVLGTVFDVALREDSAVSVSVVSGSVRVRNNAGEEVVLTDAQKCVVSDGKFLAKEDSKDLNYLFWQTKKLSFEDEKMYSVFQALSEAYDVDIAIRDTAFGNSLLTAKYTDQSIESIFEILEFSFGVDIAKTDSVYYVDKANP